jgi:hypothetical protein
MTLDEVLDQKFDAGRHMDSCTNKVVDCGMSVNYVPNHKKKKKIDAFRLKYSEIKLHLREMLYVLKRLQMKPY